MHGRKIRFDAPGARNGRDHRSNNGEHTYNRRETGVGKELVARAIHALSYGRNKKFVAVNCGAIPEGLIESALFGHERGAFTGAYEVHHGLFERAVGGTLFLDEIDSLPLAAQVSPLESAARGRVRTGGWQRDHEGPTRESSPPGTMTWESLVSQGTFRRDLYYRLNVVPIYIAPLRERKDDIPDLVDYNLTKLEAKIS